MFERHEDEYLRQHEDEFPMRIDTPEIAIVNDASEDADELKVVVDSTEKIPTKVKEVVKVSIQYRALSAMLTGIGHTIHLFIAAESLPLIPVSSTFPTLRPTIWVSLTHIFQQHTASTDLMSLRIIRGTLQRLSLQTPTLQNHLSLRYFPYYIAMNSCVGQLTIDPEIIRDMMQDIITSSEEDQQPTLRNDLQEMLKQVHSQSHGDFQALALSVVQFRNSRLADKMHFIDLS